MSKDNNSDKESFKVNDRRRFDDKGGERSADSGKSTTTSGPNPGAMQAARESAADNPVTFSSFVMSLAMQTLIQLGETPAPEGVQIPVDVAAAKQHIDLLLMIKDKTKGNLDQNESRMIEEILHALRMAFVKKS